MNPIIIDIEAFVVAYEAKQWLTVLQLGLKIAGEIAAVLGPSGQAKAHAAGLRGGEEAVLLAALKSEVEAVKKADASIVASVIPWGNLLALVLALLQKLLPVIAP